MSLLLILVVVLILALVRGIVRLMELPFRFGGYRRRGVWGGGGYGYGGSPYGCGCGGYGSRRRFGLGRGLLTVFVVLSLLRLFGHGW